MTAPAMPLPSSGPPSRYGPGDMVAGKYLLERVIGEGGMGCVWLAHNLDLDVPVALKLVRADAAPLGAAERLKREAHVEAQLEHRGIVRVFDCGETEHGDPFIVMEHLEGSSLADVLDEKGRISATSAARTLLPIIDGLSAAHAHGVVHRDVKPENIILARGPRHVQPKVVDFGIAKLDRWDPKPSLTLKGAVLGSPSYMSPEQARGLDDVDHRADIWAVCAVLYETITGSPPFRGETYNSILRSIIEDEITPLCNAGGADAELWVVIERGFAKDRTARFQSMRALGQALARFLLRHGVTEDVCGDSLVTTWELDRESTRSLPELRSARAAAPIEVRPGTVPPPPSAAVTSFTAPGTAIPSGGSPGAPSSAAGLVAPRGPRRVPLVVPAAAALSLLMGVASSMWGRSDAVVSSATATSASQERRATGRIDAPLEPVLPVAPPSAASAPALDVAQRSLVRPLVAPASRSAKARRPAPAAGSARRAGRHGWPAKAGTTPHARRAPLTNEDTSLAPALQASYP